MVKLRMITIFKINNMDKQNNNNSLILNNLQLYKNSNNIDLLQELMIIQMDIINLLINKLNLLFNKNNLQILNNKIISKLIHNLPINLNNNIIILLMIFQLRRVKINLF